MSQVLEIPCLEKMELASEIRVLKINLLLRGKRATIEKNMELNKNKRTKIRESAKKPANSI